MNNILPPTNQVIGHKDVVLWIESSIQPLTKIISIITPQVSQPASKSNRPPRALCPSPWCGYYRNLPRLHLTATHRHPSTLPPAIESFVTTMKVTRYTSFRCFLCLISCSLSPIVSRMLHTMSWVIGRQGCSFVAGWLGLANTRVGRKSIDKFGLASICMESTPSPQDYKSSRVQWHLAPKPSCK